MLRRWWRWWASAWTLIVLVMTLAGCGGTPRPTAAFAFVPTRWIYDVDLDDDGTLLVRGTFVGAGTARLEAIAYVAPHITDLRLEGDPPGITVRRDSWWVPACRTRCALRYTVKMTAVARACGRGMMCPVRRDGAVLASMDTWLVRPDDPGDAWVTVHFHPRAAKGLVTGLTPSPNEEATYSFRAVDLAEGAFTTFGATRNLQVEVPHATVDVAVLGRELAMGDADLRGWVGDAAGAVSRLYGRFPVDHFALFLVPARGASAPLFGRVLTRTGASGALLVGEHMGPEGAHDDWILVHEMIHLGFPSFAGEGRWLGEGIATYYEPILRARAGWMDPADLWTYFGAEMPRGLPKRADGPGLDGRLDNDSIYWGGALFALLADVRIREATGGRFSLDDVLRGIHRRGGDATRVWRMTDVFEEGDAITGTHVLTDLYAAMGTAEKARVRGAGRGGDGVHAAPAVDVAREVATRAAYGL